jgi:DNA helicase HerA-like ATPase
MKFPDFYLYIDEFQNFTTPAISSILSEARKYRLSLNVAHQFMAQLDDKIKNAVLGNVGTMAVCRIADGDAEQLVPYFAPQFKKEDILKLENMNCYMKLLSGGSPQQPFNMANNRLDDVYKEQGKPEIVERVKKVKELSYLKYGRPREEVEEETMVKFRAGGMPSTND